MGGSELTPLRLKPPRIQRSGAARPPVIAQRLLVWFASHARDLPWRRTLDPYAIWVSEIMLQQTQVKTVIPYFERWLLELPDATKLAAAPANRLHKLWEGLGYYTRVRNLQKAAQIVVTQHDARFPTGFDAILALPGIGRYTAGAVSSIAFNQPRPIVDGNVVRVLARLFAIHGNPKDKTAAEQFWLRAATLVEAASRIKLVPLADGSPLQLAGNCSALNQSLMELGATVCTPVNPRCGECPVRSLCTAHSTNQVAHFPQLGKRAATIQRRFVAFVVRRARKVLIRQRPAGVVNAQLWEFPNVEIDLKEAEPAVAAARALGLKVADMRPLGTVRHSITRYRITLECFRAEAAGRVPRAAGSWTPFNQLTGLAFTAAHQKLLKRAGLEPA